jgi:hypothetical protein
VQLVVQLAARRVRLRLRLLQRRQLALRLGQLPARLPQPLLHLVVLVLLALQGGPGAVQLARQAAGLRARAWVWAGALAGQLGSF